MAIYDKKNFVRSLMYSNNQSFMHREQSNTWRAVSGDYVGKGDVDYYFIRLIDETIIESYKSEFFGRKASIHHKFKGKTVYRIRRRADSDFIELFCSSMLNPRKFSIEYNKDAEELQFLKITLKLGRNDKIKESSKLVNTKRHCDVIAIHMDCVAEVKKEKDL